MLQIKTTIDFGEDGIPLDRLGEITMLLKERHVGVTSRSDPDSCPSRSSVSWTCTCKTIRRLTGGIRAPAEAGRGCAQGGDALCLWSVHLGDRLGRSRRRMLYLYYRRSVARQRLRDRRSAGPSARLTLTTPTTHNARH